MKRLKFSFIITLIIFSTTVIAKESNNKLEMMAESDSMIWNAVAVDDQQQVYLAGPRWTGSQKLAVAVLDKQKKLQPYPTKEWNNWKKGDDASKKFVNVNAIHRDNNNGLWVIDTGSPEFGGKPLPNGAKAVRINLGNQNVDKVIYFDEHIALASSYIDDIRFNGQYAYLTDAGSTPAIIVINLETGNIRRVLENHSSLFAKRPIILDNKTLLAPNGSPLIVNADPLEVSPDVEYLYFAPLTGPWYRIKTNLLNDLNKSNKQLADAVEYWADLPPVGGTAIDNQGNLYYTELATNSLKVLKHDGQTILLIQDPLLHWVDAPYLDNKGYIWLPVPQMDRVALFNANKSHIKKPIMLYRFKLPNSLTTNK